MDAAALFDTLAGVIRSIPRSELLVAALAAMVLGWLGSALIRKHRRLGGVLRTLSSVALGLILVTVVLQLSRMDPRLDIAVPQLGLPEQQVVGGETRIPLSPDGHYWVRASVNGVPANFMIDTGATLTAISQPIADEAGLEPRRGGIPVMISTANGTISAKVASVPRFSFGNVEAAGLDAVVSPSFGDTNVIGMNLLARLESWRVEKGDLVLVPDKRDRAE